ncbi:hypothetical protein DMP23_21275 [Amycolatopsis sp. A1MSW2902]|uniref:hypothetical protein n=1 Tax=Amycolatopsis sp. A1MSW2902 TaxID=687413 RepID=UPI00307D1552
MLETRARKIIEQVVSVGMSPRNRIIGNGRREWLAKVADGRTVLSFGGPAWDPARRAQAAGEIHQAAVFHRWNSARVVYAVHPNLVSAVSGMTSDEVPGPVWQRFPDPDPLVIFADPPSIAVPGGRTGRLLGFLVHGRRPDTSLCSIHDPSRAAVGLWFLTQLHGGDFDAVRTHIDTTASLALDSMVDNGLAQFEATDADSVSTAERGPYLRTLLDLAVSCCLYACADGADLTVLPPSSARHVGHKPKRGTRKALGWNLAADDSYPPGQPLVPGHLETYWPADDSSHCPRLEYHARQTLQQRLSAVTGQLRTARRDLHIERTTTEGLRAQLITARTQRLQLEASSARASSSRRRLVQAVLRYRAEASRAGSPDHVQALQRQLERHQQHLANANTVIADLTTELQRTREQLEQRHRTAWSPAEPAPSAAQPDAPAEAAFRNWHDLIAAASQIPHLWLAPDLLDEAKKLPARHDWLASAWRALRAFSGYASAKIAARAGGGTPVQTFLIYLDSTTTDSKIARTQYAPTESETVLNNERFLRHRRRPAPPEVDLSGTSLYLAHVRVGQTAPYPRLHVLDAVDTAAACVCVGYLGAHLPSPSS